MTKRLSNLDRTLKLVHALTQSIEGLSLDEMAALLAVNRRTVERLRNVILIHFDLDETVDGRIKRFRIKDSPGRAYALPHCTEKPLREVLETLGDNVPWAESFAVAPDQTASAIATMLRHLMMATRDLEPGSITTDALPSDGRARIHIDALRDLWLGNPAIVPADLATLKAFLASEAAEALQSFQVIWDPNCTQLTSLERAVAWRGNDLSGKRVRRNRVALRRER